MERTITEYEIKGEHKLIREITTTYYTTSDGVEHKGNPHRHPQNVPGTLDESGVYAQNPMTGVSNDVKALINNFWTSDVHASYEAHLKA